MIITLWNKSPRRAACDRRRIPEQLKAALDLASRAVQLYKREWGYDWRQMALGMAEYRNGRYAEADKTLAAAAETGGAEPPGADHVGVLPRHELVQAGPGRGGPPACAWGPPRR